MAAVAIVIPTYNADRAFLRDAVESVRRQTFCDYHLYVVDDGSELPVDIPDDGVTTIVKKANSGVSRARNLGVSLGSEDLVAFLDQDDSWHADKLAKQIDLLRRRPDAAGCFTWARAIDAAGHDRGAAYGAYERDITDGRALGGGVILSSLVVRRAAFLEAGGFDPMLRIVQDWDLLVRLSCVGPVLACREFLTGYRVHAANASQDFRALADESALVLHRIGRLLPAEERADVLRARAAFARLAAGKARASARHAADNRRFREAGRIALWAQVQYARARLAAGRARLGRVTRRA